MEYHATYSCSSCGRMYVENKEQQWVECDYCDAWYHARCIDVPVSDALDENMDYTSTICVDQGFFRQSRPIRKKAASGVSIVAG